MRKILLIILSLFIAVQGFGKVKYVFLFIGDGMGLNQIHMTETYFSSINGEIGFTPLCFTQFPVAGIATTYCAEDYVTDSAAAGTAIATGFKTNRGVLGLDADGNRIETVAEMAKRSGKKVAILTTVGVNHATPAAFYAHQPARNMNDEILGDLIASNFDVFAGDAIHENKPGKTVYPDWEARAKAIADAGITLVGSTDEFRAEAGNATKMLFIPDDDHKLEYRYYAGKEQVGSCTSLRDMVECSVEFMMKGKGNKGFFLMAEGGRIDFKCHGSDAAMAMWEIVGMDEAVKYAYDFYKMHPKETAIIITADHETGGLSLEFEEKAPHEIAQLQYQVTSESDATRELRDLMKCQEEVVSWEQVKELLAKDFGFWKDVELTPEEEAEIRAEYDATVARRESGHVVDPFAYADNASIVAKAVSVLNTKAGMLWSTGAHTAGYVPVYAIGPGTEIFSSKNDNTDIARKIAVIAKYK